MTLRLLLLIASAALNVGVLAAFFVQPSLAPAALRDLLPPSQRPGKADAATTSPIAPPATKASDSSARRAQIWSALHSNDLTALVARLRAAGFPPSMIRAIVDAEVEMRFGPRLRELNRKLAETPYWKGDQALYSGNSKYYEERSQIYRERSRLVRELLGKDAFAYGLTDPSTAQRQQFGDLPQWKIDRIQRINDDYAEMTGQVRIAMQGVTLPEDREKLALLEREKRSDLASVLTPEELLDYEMRTSSVTMRLRTPMNIMDATDAEFRAIYQAHAAVQDTLYPTMFVPDMTARRDEARQQVEAQVKAALSPARYAEYQRANDQDFQQLYRIGQRDGVPYDTLVRAHDVRAGMIEASTRIYDDRGMSIDQKREALQQLAASARTQVVSTLGPTAGPAYADASRWLLYLNQGRAISQQPDGSVMFRSLPTSRPRPKQ